MDVLLNTVVQKIFFSSYTVYYLPSGMLNTPISNGHGGGGSNTPIVNLDGQPNAQSNNNTVYSTSAPVSSPIAPPAGSSDAGKWQSTLI